MATLRNIRWLPLRNVATPGAAGWSLRTRWGRRSRRNRFVVACTRRWTSSPMGTPWAASAKTSVGPLAARTPASTGPIASRTNRSRSMATSLSTPNHGTWPEPWLMLEEGDRRAGLARHHIDRRRGADRGGHGHHRGVVVGRVQVDVAGLDGAGGTRGIRGPALGHDRGLDRPPERVAHLGPHDGRAAVQDRALSHGGHHGAGPVDAVQERHALIEPPHHLGVGPIDTGRLRPQQPGQHGDKVFVPSRRDPPVDPDDGHALVAQGLLEQHASPTLITSTVSGRRVMAANLRSVR